MNQPGGAELAWARGAAWVPNHFHIGSRLETLPFPSTPPSDIPHAARDEPRLSLAHWFVTLRLSLNKDFSKW